MKIHKPLKFVSADGGRYFVPIPSIGEAHGKRYFYWDGDLLECKVSRVIGLFYREDNLKKVGDITRPLVERMKQDIDSSGTVIAWYSSYEKQRNSKLVELHPDYAEFLEIINDKMFDLMTIFSKNYYVDPAFKGSSSIKKVLPVIVSELTYKSLNISKGDQASERWEKMISESTPEEERKQIGKDLLEYCKLDTWAMVKIYEFLRKI